MAQGREVVHTRSAELHGHAIDREVAELALRQHGVVARRQLARLGMTRSEIGHRVSCGSLHVLRRGVYAVGHRGVSREGRWIAALLAVGDDAVLSHRSAAALWGIRHTSRGRIDVTAPRALPQRAGIQLHRTELAPDEVTAERLVMVTTPARTLVDLAAVLPPHELERALNEAEILRLTDTTPSMNFFNVIDVERERERSGRSSRKAASATPSPAASSKTASSPSSTKAFSRARKPTSG